ncbi:thiamine pyrophosphate-dependent enzyme, partial [Mesorhizobium sp. WSM3876]|uniref:thiamine pyrophosphate-dependent enzyme n=2 Tax=unclassified Mesorhizobium TaxID=325217 RepID=UPI0032B01347
MSALQLSHQDLLKIYRTMRMIRRFEERVMAEMATGDIPGNTHLYAGQEASAVGVCLQLEEG